MDLGKVIVIHDAIKRLEAAIKQPVRNIPAGAGRDSDDLSKVAANDIIGKSDSIEELKK